MATTLKETLAQLEALGNEKVRAQNSKNGAGDNQFGVRLGDIRKLATKIKTNHALAIALLEMVIRRLALSNTSDQSKRTCQATN